MTNNRNLDITAEPDAPLFWSADDLLRWRAGASSGATITYFAGPSSLMRERTRDAALEQTAAMAWYLYMQGRAVLTFVQRADGVGEYRANAADLKPVVERDRNPAPSPTPKVTARRRKADAAAP